MTSCGLGWVLSAPLKEGGSTPRPLAQLSSSLQMFRRRVNGALRRSDSQQAVKSPPLLVSRTLQPWVGGQVQSQALTCCVPEELAVPLAGLGQAQTTAGLSCFQSPGKGKRSWTNSVIQTLWGQSGAGRRRGGCCVP